MSLLTERGISDVAVSFGFTPDAPQQDDVGVGYTVPIGDVPSFIAERERTKGFRLDLFDCWIELLTLDARFCFCNDRDVHVRLRRGTRFHPCPLASKRIQWVSR